MSKILEALKKAGSDADYLQPDPEQLAAMQSVGGIAPDEPQTVEPVLDQPSVAHHVTHSYRTVSVQLHDRPVLPFDGLNKGAAEQYRILRTNILYHPMQPKVVVVSSAVMKDGKTFSAINTAGALALKNRTSVLLMDCDLRRPAVAASLGIDASPGLGNVLLGECSLDDAIVRLDELSNLHVLPAGKTSLNPTELFDSDLWRNLVLELRTRFSIIVIDTVPVAAVADFDLVQSVGDGVIFVARPDHTGRKALNTALGAIPRHKLLGVLINGYEDWFLHKASNYEKYYV